MKHTRLTTALLLILTVFIITSCSKKDEPEPSMGDQVAGNYTFNKFTFSGFTGDLPFTDPTSGTTLSGKVEVKKVADDKVTAAITLSYKDKAGKVTDEPSSPQEVTLKKATTGEIEAYLGSSKIGTYNNGLLSLNVNHSTFGAGVLSGKKN